MGLESGGGGALRWVGEGWRVGVDGGGEGGALRWVGEGWRVGLDGGGEWGWGCGEVGGRGVEGGGGEWGWGAFR